MNDRALVIGEALIDVVRTPDGGQAEYPGGSPLNVAVGLARLERDVDLLTWFARGRRGALIAEHLAASGVHVAPGSDGAERTATAEAFLDENSSATYRFDLVWDPPALADPTPLVVHTGSIGAVLEPGDANVVKTIDAARRVATVTYDPNVRPDLMGSPADARAKIEAIVALSDVVKVSDEDLDWLFPGVDVLDVARDWLGHGPGLVVVTRGGDGALGVTAGGDVVEVPTPKVEVADTVGAGDSFMAGLIDGLWRADLLGRDREPALRAIDVDTAHSLLHRAAQAAAITVSRPGANPPWLKELTP